MEQEQKTTTLDLVSLVTDESATAEDLTRNFLDAQKANIRSKQEHRIFLDRKFKYEQGLRRSYFKKARKVLIKTWGICGRSRFSHDFTDFVMEGDTRIITCRICGTAQVPASEEWGSPPSKETRYNTSQVQVLADLLIAKDKEAGLILSYEESIAK